MTFATYTTKNTAEIMADFKTSDKGLAPAEAAKRLAEYGPNAIRGRQTRWWHVLGRQLKSPFIYILFVAAGLALFLKEGIDALMIAAFVFINAALGFGEEYHSERALQLLKTFVKARARVRRGGKETLIDSAGLVPGDVILVETGDMMPADIRFFETNGLSVDESILTGESAPANKTAEALANAAGEIQAAANIGFSGTTVAAGKGVGVVLATGANTILGDISKLTAETHRASGFEKGIAKFSRFILRMILLILVLMFLANVAIKGREANVWELLLFAIALAVSVIPEALPLVTTISLSKGALKMAKNHVVVKRLSAIEDLGSVEILCVDKTGTITENKMKVDKIFADGAADREKCLLHAALASSFLGDKKREPNNSFDIALWNKLNAADKKAAVDWERVSEIPFDPERRRNSVLLKRGGSCLLIARGAPEAVLNLCVGLGAEEKKKIANWLAREGQAGRRTVAVGHKEMPTDAAGYAADEESGLIWDGAVSFIDPIKSTTKQAVEQAKKLGVRVKILTGDSREVAGAVAGEIGLVDDVAAVITGEELEKMNSEARHDAVQKYHVFARVSPRQKYDIIQLLQEKNEVGFLGEGINDAPALKMAHVALAVQGASDIAREAADIVLLNQSLAVIIGGIKEGRAIFANTVKYIKTTLISNFGNFYAIAVASLLVAFLPMLPVQILLLNLLSDFPMIAIATDTVDTAELRRPRSYNIKEVVLMAVLLGLVSTIFDFIFFALFFRHQPVVLQTSWFMGSVLTEIVLIYSIRTHYLFVRAKRPSGALLGLTVAAVAATIILPFTAFGANVFKFVRPEPAHLYLIFGVVAGYFAITEILKLFYYRWAGYDVDKRG